MKPRAVIWISLSLNLALAALAAYVHSRRGDSPPPQSATPAAPSVQRIKKPAPAKPEPDSPPAAEPAAAFTWAQLASKDLRQYCANLRSVGCPEKTIRDILLPVIDKHYAARAAELPPEAAGPFWRGGAQRQAAETKRAQAYREIQGGKAALIRELFGMYVDQEGLREWHREMGAGLFLGFLPEGKPEQVLSLANLFHDQGRDVRNAARNILTPEDRDQMRRLYEQLRAEAAGLLTPVEFEEVELRLAGFSVLRYFAEKLFGMEMTSLEMRELLRSMKGADSPILQSMLDDSDEEAQLAAQFEPQLRRVLGQERYAFYAQMKDEAFRKIMAFTQEHDLPRSTATKVYEVTRAAREQEDQIRRDASLTAAAREAALKEAQELTRNGMRALIGDKLAEEILSKGGRR